MSNMLKNPMSNIPLLGLVRDHLKQNDYVICDVDSLNLWIHFSIQMDSLQNQVDSELELKVEKDMTGASFLAMTQKLCLQLWQQLSLDDSKLRTN